MTALVLGSFKALMLFAAAAGISLFLKGSPARIRVVVWSTALAGSMLIPVVAPLLPSVAVPLPIDLSTTASGPILRAVDEPVPSSNTSSRGFGRTPPESQPYSPIKSGSAVQWGSILWVVWISGVVVLASRLAVGMWFMGRTVRLARPITEKSWLDDLEHLRRKVHCRRPVRLVKSDVLEIPATVGLLRPTIILPEIAETWPSERREAVLLHELVHVVRMDWPWRLVARAARAIYWFNPLVWWAVRRLDLEQELACDQEVVALGARPSSYACHLLGIARTAVRQPIPAVCGLEMARRSHLEERIMTILENKHQRRVGLTILIPAVILVAAMVPALAAMAPSDHQTSASTPELKQVLTEIKAAEARMEPHLERIEEFEFEVDDEAMAAIEEQMEPYVEKMAQIEVQMEPYLEHMEEIEREMENLEIYVEPGKLADIERQIHEQLEAVHRQLEQVHLEMEPLHQQLQAIHEQMEPFHEQMEQLHLNMEPMHAQMEVFHREMEPFHEEMEALGQRLQDALRGEVAGRLKFHLGPVTGPNAPFTESAERILDGAEVHVDDDLVTVNASSGDTRQILNDLLGPHRIGAQQNFDNAVHSAAAEMSNLEIRAD